MDKAKFLQPNRFWLKNYDRHIPADIHYQRTNLVKLFEDTAKKYPNKPFLTSNEYTFSFECVSNLVDNLTISLIRLGLKKGDRVALILPNIPQFVIAYYAILKAGGIVVAMNPNYKLSEFQFLFKDSLPKYVFCLGRHQDIIMDLAGIAEINSVITTTIEDIPFLVPNEPKEKEETRSKFYDFLKLLKPDNKEYKISYPELTPEDPAVFQYSGGTTGIPKAAIGLHKNITANVIQFRTWCDLKEGKEVVLAVIPLYHVYGMVLALNIGANIAANVILVEDPRDTDFILEEIEKHSVTFYPGVPSMYYAINQNQKVRDGKCDLTSIKACISGSAPLHPQIKEEFERLTGGRLVEGYGLSEAPTATHCNPLFGKNKADSIGLPLPDVDCRVVDLETGLIDMAIGEPGELILKGPQVMQGYHNNPAENNLALRDGWLYTGDVVRMDDEGYFFIIDRKKSLIKVGGFQVWPNEIETVINSHPKVKESAVGGVPDIEKGEKVIAWIVRESDQDLDTDEILQWCEKQLVFYKIPSEILFVERIPRTGMGKVLRRELISEYNKSRGCPKSGQPLFFSHFW
ncbi:MAG: long-chain fatty acid--CoA ligase [Pelolinea sp.]|nr:long-chain fatty acid--CoA ligase [Pelolinea sp.]